MICSFAIIRRHFRSFVNISQSFVSFSIIRKHFSFIRHHCQSFVNISQSFIFNHSSTFFNLSHSFAISRNFSQTRFNFSSLIRNQLITYMIIRNQLIRHLAFASAFFFVARAWELNSFLNFVNRLLIFRNFFEFVKRSRSYSSFWFTIDRDLRAFEKEEKEKGKFLRRVCRLIIESTNFVFDSRIRLRLLDESTSSLKRKLHRSSSKL
jgi:hypothetical protein